MSGGFNFQVNDGVNFTPRQIFSITAKALVLSLEKNRPLMVFPGKSCFIIEKKIQMFWPSETMSSSAFFIGLGILSTAASSKHIFVSQSSIHTILFFSTFTNHQHTIEFLTVLFPF